MDYLDFIEEHQKDTLLNLFQKVLVASNRAKDLFEGKTSKLEKEKNENHKPTTIAIYEINHNLIEAKEVVIKKEINLDENQIL